MPHLLLTSCLNSKCKYDLINWSTVRSKACFKHCFLKLLILQVSCKACWPYVVIHLDRTPIFKWYMARLVVKNGHQNDTCYYEIGLHSQNIDTILGQHLTHLGGVYVIIKGDKIFTLTSYNFCISIPIPKLGTWPSRATRWLSNT